MNIRVFSPESILFAAIEKPDKRVILFRLAHVEARRYWNCACAIGRMGGGQ